MEIAKCKGDYCPIKDNCIRFTVEVGDKQDWFASIPYKVAKNKCEFFIDNNVEPDHEIYIGKNSKP